jgi:hypothetical protein
VDQEVQQGKCEEVVIRARLSEKEKKGKWYIRNAATFKVSILYSKIFRQFFHFSVDFGLLFKTAYDFGDKTYMCHTVYFFMFMTLNYRSYEKIPT